MVLLLPPDYRHQSPSTAAGGRPAAEVAMLPVADREGMDCSTISAGRHGSPARWMIVLAECLDQPWMTFLWLVLLAQYGLFPLLMAQAGEVRQQGLVWITGFKTTFMPWQTIQHCKWTKSSGRLQVQLQQRMREYPVPADQVNSATSVLCRFRRGAGPGGRSHQPRRPQLKELDARWRRRPSPVQQVSVQPSHAPTADACGEFHFQLVRDSLPPDTIRGGDSG